MSKMHIFDTFPEIDLDENFYLREQNLNDIQDFLDYYSNPEVCKYILASIPKNIYEAEIELKYWIDLYRNRKTIYWAIARKSDNKMIGAAGFNNWDHYNNRTEISYDLAREYWHQGICSKALKKIVDFAFTKMQLNRIQASTLKENIGSIKVLEKTGFTYDGTLQEYRYHMGKYYNIELYAITYKLWRQKHLNI